MPPAHFGKELSEVVQELVDLVGRVINDARTRQFEPLVPPLDLLAVSMSLSEKQVKASPDNYEQWRLASALAKLAWDQQQLVGNTLRELEKLLRELERQAESEAKPEPAEPAS